MAKFYLARRRRPSKSQIEFTTSLKYFFYLLLHHPRAHVLQLWGTSNSGPEHDRLRRGEQVGDDHPRQQGT